jgi:hypothetical protein
MGGVALSKTAGDARLGGGCVGVVWGGFLCGRVGGRTTTQNQLGMSVSGYWPTTPWHPQPTGVLATSWETPGTRDLFYFELWGLLWASKHDPLKKRVMGGATALGGRKSKNKSNNQPKTVSMVGDV